ncbi:MAG TPA: hypothetical protein VI864_07745 [Candidatus Bathyarchaeia archaeon]|nr:hypothetical protein [Candidatus Bathyarchaeia archaeon]
MSFKFTPMSGRELMKILCNYFGFELENNYGSHVILINKNYHPPLLITVFMHNKLLPSSISHIVADAHIDRKEFLKYC